MTPIDWCYGCGYRCHVLMMMTAHSCGDREGWDVPEEDHMICRWECLNWNCADQIRACVNCYSTKEDTTCPNVYAHAHRHMSDEIRARLDVVPEHLLPNPERYGVLTPYSSDDSD